MIFSLTNPFNQNFLANTLLFLFVFSASLADAQVKPEIGAHLNYTQILFEIPSVSGAVGYEYKLITKHGGFDNPLISKKDDTHVTVIENLEFGEEYKWKVIAYGEKSNIIFESAIFDFKIDKSLFVDTALHQFRIIKNDSINYKNGVLFLDYSSVAIDRAGKPVWFMPEQSGLDINRDRIRDLRINSAGTITYMGSKMCRDVDINGNILWETPKEGIFSGDSLEIYHHDFSRLNSGNYMALGKTNKEGKLILGDQVITQIPMSVIIEYNPLGDTVWSWNSGQYVKNSDILEVGHKVFKGNTFGHMNSLYVNDERNEVYAGFRDLNALVIIDKSTRQVKRTYGDKIPSDTTKQAQGFFQRQHGIMSFTNDKFLLFNNNTPEERGRDIEFVSSVQIVSEAFSESDSSQILWQFNCDFDKIMPGSSARMGNVVPIDTTHFLVNMGMTARLFEVTYDKHVIWDCLPEKRENDTLEWKPEPNYRIAFSSSLYPCYFSVCTKNNRGNSGENILSIANEGSESDSYSVEFLSDSKKKVYFQVDTGILNPGESFELPIKLKKRLMKKGPKARVVSSKNSRLVKILEL